MERIKKAIEHAKSPGASAQSAEYKDRDEYGHFIQAGQRNATWQWGYWTTLKYLLGALLIFFAGWMWLRLDFMNQLELVSSQYINESIQLARADTRRRASEEERYRQLAKEGMDHCLEIAQKDKEAYMKLALQELQRKSRASSLHEKIVIPKSTMNEADRLLEAAQGECRQRYEAQLKQG